MSAGRAGRGRGALGARHGGGSSGGGGHGGGDARWLVTYADLLTLLMVLFLVLWVISRIDLAKFEEFKQGLGDFRNPAAAAASDATGAPSGQAAIAVDGLTGDGGAAGTEAGEGASADAAIDASSAVPGAPPATTAAPTTTVAPAGATTVAPGATVPAPDGTVAPLPGIALPVLDEAGLAAAAEAVRAAVEAAGLPDVVAVTTEERGLVVRIASDDVLFDSGSAEVTDVGAQILSVLAPSLMSFSNSILVEGHTDDRPLRRAGYDNWDLSVDRAVSVIKLLRDGFGLPPDRLGAAGYADQRPIATGDDDASLARNRRVEIVVLAGPGA